MELGVGGKNLCPDRLKKVVSFCHSRTTGKRQGKSGTWERVDRGGHVLPLAIVGSVSFITEKFMFLFDAFSGLFGIIHI